MSNPIRYEVALIWSHAVVDDVRQFKAFNRCFDNRPTDIELAKVVADKNDQLEAEEDLYPDPLFHRMELRTVETQDCDLASIVEDYNTKYYPDEESDDGS